MKKILLTICALFGAFHPAYANEQPTAQETTQAVAQTEKKLTLHVEEMNCQLCVYLVNKELRAVDGVISTKASMKTRRVDIVAKQNVDTQTLIQAVEKLHYSAKVL